MMMAITPSLNASSRFVSMRQDYHTEVWSSGAIGSAHHFVEEAGGFSSRSSASCRAITDSCGLALKRMWTRLCVVSQSLGEPPLMRILDGLGPVR